MKTVSSLLAILLLAVAPLVAQQSSTVTGGLNGVVVDSTGAVVAGATVTLSGPQGNHVVTTDASGHYSESGLIPGFYDVTVEKTGFKKVKSVHDEVVVNVSSLLNITLPVGSAEETVEVTATAVGIDTLSTAIAANFTDTFYNSVPMARTVSGIEYRSSLIGAGALAKRTQRWRQSLPCRTVSTVNDPAGRAFNSSASGFVR